MEVCCEAWNFVDVGNFAGEAGQGFIQVEALSPKPSRNLTIFTSENPLKFTSSIDPWTFNILQSFGELGFPSPTHSLSCFLASGTFI